MSDNVGVRSAVAEGWWALATLGAFGGIGRYGRVAMRRLLIVVGREGVGVLIGEVHDELVEIGTWVLAVCLAAGQNFALLSPSWLFIRSRRWAAR